MGTVASSSYGHLKWFFNRYNAQYRALKFIEKHKLPPSPPHKTRNAESKAIKLSEKVIEELHNKNEQLDNYLKKVYLTSVDEGKKVEYTRPLPVKRELDNKLIFYEPPKPKPKFCTLTLVVEMLLNHQANPNLNASALAKEYDLDKESVVNLMTYYSLFTREDFEFMNKDKEEEDDKPKKIEFEVFTRLEKRPLRQIEGKK